MTKLKDINCLFSYISILIFTLGIIAYSYYLHKDLKEEGYRSTSEQIWIWGLFILLFAGLFVSYYCVDNVENVDLHECIINETAKNHFSNKFFNKFNKFSSPNFKSKRFYPKNKRAILSKFIV